jgi:hypothetical protein
MPKFRLVSGKGIIAQVVRGAGGKIPSTYLDDILEYIPEGLGMLLATNALILTSSGDKDCPGEILVKNHCACLPAGFITIEGVEDECGRRMLEGSDVTDFTRPTAKARITPTDKDRANVFEVDPTTYQTSSGVPTTKPGTSIPLFGEDIVQSTPQNRTNDYYRISGNYIQTSFECGYVKLHYWALPVDKEGYPLIPDNENFKQAIEWHVIRRLIGSGYEHKVFSYQFADEKFEFYAARALTEVSYPSADSMARLHHLTVRLIPPSTYHEDFGIGYEQQEVLRK